MDAILNADESSSSGSGSGDDAKMEEGRTAGSEEGKEVGSTVMVQEEPSKETAGTSGSESVSQSSSTSPPAPLSPTSKLIGIGHLDVNCCSFIHLFVLV